MGELELEALADEEAERLLAVPRRVRRDRVAAGEQGRGGRELVMVTRRESGRDVLTIHTELA